jgi:hypothetical protein
METINFIAKKSIESDPDEIIKILDSLGVKNITRTGSTFNGLLKIKRGKPENILRGLVDKDIGIIQVTGLTINGSRDKDFFYPPIEKSEVVNSFKYDKYFGSIGFCIDSNCFYGEVLGINSLVNYEAETLEQLEKEFIYAVEDYLRDCLKRGLKPEISVTNTGSLKIVSFNL